MKRIMLVFVFLLLFSTAAQSQDDYFCYDCNYNEDGTPKTLDHDEWVKRQEQLISEGYATIFDTDAYKNGDYYIREDGRVALGSNPVTGDRYTKNQNNFIDGYYDGYMGDDNEYQPSNTKQPNIYSKVTWKCVDATSFDGIANNDNKCTSSTGQVKYVSDSEAIKLDPKYRPGKSGAWYYNNK